MRGLITSILTAIAITSLQAQVAQTNRPKVIVGLNVDQLSTELIEAYWNLYSEEGFKKLWREGLVYTDTEFSLVNRDRSNTTATLNTGATPSVHGIIGNEWLDLSVMQPRSCVFDPNFMGNNTPLSSSATNLLSSTITDELKLSTQGRALVYSIAPFADMAILSAGHAADAALWFNQETGEWAGSTYYSEFPWWVNKHNEQNPIYYRLNNIEWTPSLETEQYNISSNGKKKAFRHSLTNSGQNMYSKVVNSPIINDEVTILAKELFESSGVAEDDITDFIQLNFYAGNELGTNEGYSLELQDTYLRLDKNIAELLHTVDKKVGLKNAIFYLTSTGYTQGHSGSQLKEHKIPTGEFYLNRCTALLNMYLMATYGEGQYVEGYYDLQIYLNHQLLEEKTLSLTEVQEKSAEFLSQFSGVNEVYYSTELLLGSWNPYKEVERNSYHKKRSGDLSIEVLPGWEIIENDKVQRTVNYSAIMSPTIFLGAPFKAEVIDTPINAEAIAPTIAKSIRIRAPNGSKAKTAFK
ncbi:alkaline phosphatase family protein [Bacteroides propionicifaciens]|uniref:alkaline phosphatase family protein n=2 Tax=Bacteroides propionicifaciens TaxID=392838 RepID=UPI00035E948F|nr:alkaline phosphatase family protein [Bacteroides propionicifaciens]